MVTEMLKFKLAVAAELHDAEMWEAANRQLYVIMTAKEAE